jgi:alpha-L-rhamnosidase
MEGSVPTPKGDISVYCSQKLIRVKSGEGTGTLRFQSKSKPSAKGTKITAKGNNTYEMIIEKGREYVVAYTAK